MPPEEETAGAGMWDSSVCGTRDGVMITAGGGADGVAAAVFDGRVRWGGARVEGVCCAALPRLVDAAVALRAEVCAALVPLGFAGGGGAGVGSSLLSSSVRSRSSSIDSFCVSASATWSGCAAGVAAAPPR